MFSDPTRIPPAKNHGKRGLVMLLFETKKRKAAAMINPKNILGKGNLLFPFEFGNSPFLEYFGLYTDSYSKRDSPASLFTLISISALYLLAITNIVPSVKK